MTATTPHDEPILQEAPGARRLLGIDWSSPAPIYIGVALVVVGFAIIALAWGGVAGEDDVASQLPYIVAGGAGGLGVVLVGLTTVNLAAKRRDASERHRQLDLLAAILDRVAGRGGEQERS